MLLSKSYVTKVPKVKSLAKIRNKQFNNSLSFNQISINIADLLILELKFSIYLYLIFNLVKGKTKAE